MTQTITDLLGENITAADPYGEDLCDEQNLIAGWITPRSVAYMPQVQIGPGLVGPVNEQQLQIYRDDRPIATDELGMQGPFRLMIGKYGRQPAGRTFPLNIDGWNAGLDQGMPGLVPVQDVLQLSPFGPDQDPGWYDGNPAPEVLPGARTVFYTASPEVGWEGY